MTAIACATDGMDAEPALASAIGDARRAGVAVEALLVWWGSGAPPTSAAGGQMLPVFPACRSHACNQGVLAAQGDVVAFVDATSELMPGWAQAVLAALAEGDAVVLPAANVHVGVFAAQRSLVVDIGGFDLRLGPGSYGRAGDDRDLLERLRRRGAKIVTPSGPLVAKVSKEAWTERRDEGFGAGRVVRRTRSVAVAARSLRRLTSASPVHWPAAMAGFGAGVLRSDRWRSPARPLALMPQEIRAELEERPLEPWPVPHRPDPHFLWGAGPDRVLHAYTSGTPKQRSSLEARERAEAAGLPAVPAVVMGGADDRDGWWLLEERMAGRAPATPGKWWSDAAEWAVLLASTAGAPLRAATGWAAARAAVESTLGREGDAALELVADLPAVVVHGDLQPKNLLVDKSGRLAGVLDWEEAVPAGLPGYDLFFLAVAGHLPAERAAVIRRLDAGSDLVDTPVLGRLAQVGIEGPLVPAALRVAVALWVASERDRRARLGVPPRPPEHELLLDELSRCSLRR